MRRTCRQVNKLEITGDKTLIAAAGNPHVRLYEVRVCVGGVGGACCAAVACCVPAHARVGCVRAWPLAHYLRPLQHPPAHPPPMRPPIHPHTASTPRSTRTTCSPSCRTTGTPATSPRWASKRTASGCTRAARTAQARVGVCTCAWVVGREEGPVGCATRAFPRSCCWPLAHPLHTHPHAPPLLTHPTTHSQAVGPARPRLPAPVRVARRCEHCGAAPQPGARAWVCRGCACL